MADVFISYAREDRARAKRLAGALEARGLSVWWDREILAGQAFDEVIEAELRKAGAVVVLWSKHSVASEWVKNEATEARERGTLVPARIDVVKPPLEFRRKQTVDLTGWEGEPDHLELDALCRGISAHLGRQSTPQPAPPATVDPPRKPRRSARLFWAAVASLILAGTALWYWDAFHRRHVDYYANVIKRWGLPEGVGPLTDEEVRHRNVSLAFHKRGRWGVVHEIRAVNSRGRYPPVFTYFPSISFVGLNPFANELSEISGLCRVTFMRDADGRVVAQTGYNRSDRPLYTLHYPQPDIAEYKEGAFTVSKEASGITHIKFVRPETGPEAGLDKELRYFDRDGQPQPDGDGAYGYRSTFNVFGLAVESITLGADGQPAATHDGTVRFTSTYDGQGNTTREASFGVHGQLVLRKNSGRAELRFRYDPYGNLTEFAAFGTEGQLVTSKDRGAAGMKRAHDERGNIVENTYFGPDRQLVIGARGFAKQTIVWDEKGRSLETFFGPDGEPMLVSGKAVKLRGVWDERGYLVEVAFSDENNRSVRNEVGCAKKRFALDEQGHVAEIACLDESDQAIRSTDGAARAKRVHDERGNMVEESYFGSNGQPGRYEENYARTRWKYDSQGKKLESTAFSPIRRDAKARSVWGRGGRGGIS